MFIIYVAIFFPIKINSTSQIYTFTSSFKCSSWKQKGGQGSGGQYLKPGFSCRVRLERSDRDAEVQRVCGVHKTRGSRHEHRMFPEFDRWKACLSHFLCPKFHLSNRHLQWSQWSIHHCSPALSHVASLRTRQDVKDIFSTQHLLVYEAIVQI